MHPDLAARGVAVVALGVSDLATATRIQTTFTSPFPIVADADRIAFDAFAFGRLAFVLQRSGTVVVERGGRIRALHRALRPNHSFDRGILGQTLDEIAPVATP